MANAIVEMGVNFTLGDGLTIDCKAKKVQRLIDDFWHDPDNHMNLRQYSLATELSLYGELFIRFFVNPFSGRVKIAQIDPSLIDEIECDPDNIEHELRVHRRALGPKANAPYTQTATAPVSDVVIPAQWFSVPDEVIHFTINKVTNAKRGKSDLATLLPWLRRYKDWLIDRVRINKYKAAFLWDVTLTGADRKAIDQKAMEYSRPPEPGSINIHNESETWQAVQPKIDAGDVEADGHAMKMMVAMGAGLPEHFLSEGGDVNRATAAEMGLPTLKKYQRRQDYLKYLLSHILDRVIDEARAAGKVQAGTDTSYEIRFPELHTEDSKDIGSASWHMAQALQIVSPMGFLSRQTAQRLFFEAAHCDLDAREEWERLEQELSGAGPIAGMTPMMFAGQPAASSQSQTASNPPAGHPSPSPSPFRPAPLPSGSPSSSQADAGHRRSTGEKTA